MNKRQTSSSDFSDFPAAGFGFIRDILIKYPAGITQIFKYITDESKSSFNQRI